MSGPESLHRAAVKLRAEASGQHRALFVEVAVWLDTEGDAMARMVEDTQRPSAGVDEPPAIFYGEPEKAAEAAAYHPAFYHARRVAATVQARG